MGTAACPVCDAPLKRREWGAHVRACLHISEVLTRRGYREEQAARARRRVFGRRAVESDGGDIAFESE